MNALPDSPAVAQAAPSVSMFKIGELVALRSDPK
jgi:hypothetical protein